MANYTKIIKLELAFDYKVFSLAQEYDYLLSCIEHEWRGNSSITLKQAIDNIILKVEKNINYKNFNSIYLSRLKELTKIPEDKTYKQLIWEFYTQNKHS
jgi:hypothetical protein